MRLAPRLVLGLLLLAPAARAQSVSPESARAIHDQLQAWIANQVGPQVDAAQLTPQVTAAGDHYALRLAIPGLVGDDIASARLLPLEHDRWSLQAVQLPSDMHFNLRLPAPDDPSTTISTAVSLTIGSQDTHAVIDPSLNTGSALHIDLHDLTMRSQGPQSKSRQHVGEYRLDASLQPDPAGGLDLRQAATISGWSSSSQMPGKPAMHISADRTVAKGQIDGLNRDQAGALLAAVSGLIDALPPKPPTEGGATQLTPAQRTALRRVVESLRGIFTSIRAEQDIDGLHVTIAGVGEGSVRHAHFAFGGNAPDGLLHGWMEIAIDGLSIPTLPPETAGLVPSHMVLRPSLTGIPAAAVLQLALDATQPGANQVELMAEATTLVRKGTTLALDKLGFDIGPASVQGTGHVTVAGPNELDGNAHLVATGFDALMQQAQQDPALRRELPILIMLRGYAKQEGKQLVWNVVAQGGGLTINGMPLIQPHAAEAGHDQPPPDKQK